MSGSFNDLKVWQKAHELNLSIYKLSDKFPKTDKSILKRELEENSLQVSSNIAQSSGRFYFRDKIKFLNEAIDALYSLQNLLFLLRDLDYLVEEEFNSLTEEHAGLVKAVGAFIGSIRKKYEEKKNSGDSE